MNDDRKKPARGGGKGRGPGKSFAGGEGSKPRAGKPNFDKPRFDKARADGPRAPREGDGEAKPFRRQDGAKRAYAGRDGGAPGKPRPGKWERREATAGEGAERPRKPFAPRDGDTPRSDRPRFDGPRPGRDGDAEAKPFQRQDGAKRAFANRDGKPGKPRPGKWERREATAGEGAERPRKPFASRDGDRPRSDRPHSDRPRSERPRFDKPRPVPRDEASAAEGSGVERIARRLARAGVSSRRDAEALIAAGRITLNGKVLDSPAVNVGADDRIEIDGKPIPAIERTRLFLFHKPAGVVTTSRDPEGRRTVFDVLPEGLLRLVTIGRLDINTEGLLLMTNDGGLSRVLELPATGWLRRYRVRVHGKVDLQALEALKDGIAVDGVFYGAVEAALDREQGSNAWLTLGLREGKNREVKNILGALGLDVTRLIRVSYGPFQLGDLPEGELRELKGRYLRDQLGERLIAEAGANFDAPVLNAFADKEAPAAGPRKREDRAEARPERRREDKREARREDALGRLQTSRPKGMGKGGAGKPAKPGRFGDDKPEFREERPQEKPRSRTTNVWMAPGAKPMGEKKKAALDERTEGRRYAGKPRPSGKPSGKPGDKPRFGGKPGAGKPGGRPSGRPAGKGGPRKPRGED